MHTDIPFRAMSTAHGLALAAAVLAAVGHDAATAAAIALACSSAGVAVMAARLHNLESSEPPAAAPARGNFDDNADWHGG